MYAEFIVKLIIITVLYTVVLLNLSQKVLDSNLFI